MATTDDFQDAYFKSYGDLSVHQIMLRDQPRVLAYRRFFEENAHHIKGKTVMDVGAGTGILSLFAAGAGAKKSICC
jgi:predicted RNA methylase